MESTIPVEAIHAVLNHIEKIFSQEEVVSDTAKLFIGQVCHLSLQIQHQYRYKDVPNDVMELIVAIYGLAGAIGWYNDHQNSHEAALGHIFDNIAKVRTMLNTY